MLYMCLVASLPNKGVFVKAEIHLIQKQDIFLVYMIDKFIDWRQMYYYLKLEEGLLDVHSAIEICSPIVIFKSLL